MISSKATTSSSLVSLLAFADCVTPSPLADRDTDMAMTMICGADGVPVRDDQAYVEYLSNIGENDCAVSGNWVIFCTSGSTSISGINMYRIAGGVLSLCRHVATGAQAIIDSCNSTGGVAGENTANGNGHLAIDLGFTV